MEIAADLGANRTHDLDDEAGAVLELAAVVVLAVVDRRAEELRDEVAVRAVQFHAVRPGLARAPRPLAEGLDDILNLVGRHPLALEPVQRVLVVGRAEALGVLDPRHVALTAAVAQLQDVLAVALAMDLLDEPLPERDARVAIDRRVVGHDAAAHRHRHERRDDRADAAPGELDLPVDPRLVARPVVVVEPPGDVRAKHAVLDRQVPERQRREEVGIERDARPRSRCRLLPRAASARCRRATAAHGRAAASAAAIVSSTRLREIMVPLSSGSGSARRRHVKP